MYNRQWFGGGLFPNIKILKNILYYFFQISKFWLQMVIILFSTFYESNNGVIGILVSENMKNDSSVMLIPYLVANIY